MEKIKYFTQKELKKLFRSIERQKDYPFVLRDLAMFNIGYLWGFGFLKSASFTRNILTNPAGNFFARA